MWNAKTDWAELRRRANSNLTKLADGTIRREEAEARERRLRIRKAEIELRRLDREEMKKLRVSIKRHLAEADSIDKNWDEYEKEYANFPGAMEEFDHMRDQHLEAAFKDRQRLYQLEEGYRRHG